MFDGYEVELAVSVLLHQLKFRHKELDPVLEHIKRNIVHFLFNFSNRVNVPLVASHIGV